MHRWPYLGSVAVLVATICVGVRARSAEPAKTTAKATVTVVGEMCCAKCELGLGTDCAVGLKIGNATVALVNNKTAEKIFDARTEGGLARVSGTVRVVDGHLEVTPTEAVALAKEAKESPRFRIRGAQYCAECELGLEGFPEVGIRDRDLVILVGGKGREAEIVDQRFDDKDLLAEGAPKVTKGGYLVIEATKVEILPPAKVASGAKGKSKS